MVQSCSAQYCKERSKGGSGVSFHSFPQDDQLREQWVLAACRYNFKPQKHSRLCSKHFSPDDFINNGWSSKKVLKKEAVPKIVEKLPIHTYPKCDVLVEEYTFEKTDNIDILTGEDTEKQTINQEKVVNIVVNPDLQIYIRDESNDLVIQNENDVNNRINSQNEVISYKEGNKNVENENKVYQRTAAIDNASCKSVNNRKRKKLNSENENLKDENISNSKKNFVELKDSSLISQDCVDKLKERFLVKKKQVKMLKQRNRRLIKRINELNTLIRKQRKRLINDVKVSNDEMTNLLEPLNPTGRIIIKEMTKIKKSKIYPAELKNFALTLNFYSAKSYMYVKKIFPTMLPHPRTLLKWSLDRKLNLK